MHLSVSASFLVHNVVSEYWAGPVGKRLATMRTEEEDITWPYMETYFVAFICVHMHLKGGTVIMYAARVKSQKTRQYRILLNLTCLTFRTYKNLILMMVENLDNFLDNWTSHNLKPWCWTCCEIIGLLLRHYILLRHVFMQVGSILGSLQSTFLLLPSYWVNCFVTVV